MSYQQYSRSVTWRITLLLAVTVLLPVMLCVSIAVGAAPVPLRDTITILCGGEAEPRLAAIVLENRLPQALAAILAGAGLAISGATMQSVLRNPLSSPMTLGISNAAAFGAAMALFIGGASVSALDKSMIIGGVFSREMIALWAFAFAAAAAMAILLLGRFRGSRSETIILVGVALNSLFAAGITLLQYLADDSRLAAIVYWTIGDTARANWKAIKLMTVCLVPVSAWFLLQSWNYNAIVFGEETALGLGVPVRRVRLVTMLLSSFLTAVLVSLLGIIGFVGLVVPHVARLFVGSDNRFLLPFSL
ncbi:MAG: iron ABC transporter permease, partial [Planctomycetaceae bacterium]|nr:iron ABC transporter permease [Planctomycetaceae bacterium]